MKTSYKITKESDGLSLRKYLEGYHLGKTKIVSLFTSKTIYVNEEFVNPEYILRTNDIVSIDFKEEIDFIPDVKKLDILYEDDYILAVNKPSHILVHPDDKSKRDTLCNIVAYYYKNKGWSYQVRYAHRLDMDTTGVILFAKDSLTLAKLSRCFPSRRRRTLIFWA